MSPKETEELATKIHDWVESVNVLNIRIDLGENDTWIPLIQDKRSAAGNGIWRYYLTADGLWGTYVPTCLAMNHGVEKASRKVEPKELARAAKNCRRPYCCWKSFMYDLEHLDESQATKREHLVPQEPA